jgi:hypothetical protein
MKTSVKRTTIYFNPELHRALRLKAAHPENSISDLVNAAVKLSLAEGAIDLAAFDETKREESVNFAGVVKNLRVRAKL